MNGFQLWHLDRDHSELRPFEVMDPSGDQLVVKGEYSLISHGTERLVVRGNVPEEIYDEMKIPGMEGNFSFPLTYGYSLAGNVIEGPDLWIGQRVHLFHPHQTHAICNPQQVWKIPEGVPSSRATLASNLETALNGIWDSRILTGEKVLIVGAGLIGMLVRTILDSIPMDNCLIIDINNSKISLAKEFGWEAQLPGEIEGGSFDLAFHCSGTAGGLQSALDMVGKEGRVIELSWYGRQPVEVKLGGSFHSHRKKIISSQVSHIPGFMQHSWNFARRKRFVFRLLENSLYDRLITHRLNFMDTPRFYSRLRSGEVDELGILIEYDL